MKKVMLVFGTRPEAIKMAPIIRELKSRKGIETIVCVTAQHRQMLDQVLGVFDIVPDYDLNIMKQSQTLSYITSEVLTRINEIIEKEKPDYMVVHGDTTTTFTAALAAFYNQVKIAHVEAGLRTYNKYSPYPEEINRQMVGLVADLNFCPTNMTRDNLVKEGKDEKTIYVTGNTAIDTLKYTLSEVYNNSHTEWLGQDRLILLTAHRRENLGQPMARIFAAIRELLDLYEDIKIIYPVHKNPKILELANDAFKGCDRIRLIEPLDVVSFHNLINRSYMVMTDSGGIQEEAPSMDKPVLVLRDETERKEGLEAGTLLLVGTDKKKIIESASRLLDDEDLYKKMASAQNPYGDGKASQRIVDVIERGIF